jgi:hypothetical protein
MRSGFSERPWALVVAEGGEAAQATFVINERRDVIYSISCIDSQLISYSIQECMSFH